MDTAADPVHEKTGCQQQNPLKAAKALPARRQSVKGRQQRTGKKNILKGQKVHTYLTVCNRSVASPILTQEEHKIGRQMRRTSK